MGSPALTVSEALSGVSRFGVDTAVFIYYVEADPARFDRCLAVFDTVAAGSAGVYTSVLTLTETLVHPLRSGNVPLADAYRNLLDHTNGVTSSAVDSHIAELAADLRSRYSLRTPDAIQIATAISAGCDAFLTNDAGLRRVADIRVVVLDDLSA